MLDGLARAAESKKVRLPIAESFHRTDAIPLLTALERRLKLPGKALVTIHRADCAAIRWRCAQHARRRRRYFAASGIREGAPTEPRLCKRDRACWRGASREWWADPPDHKRPRR